MAVTWGNNTEIHHMIQMFHLIEVLSTSIVSHALRRSCEEVALYSPISTDSCHHGISSGDGRVRLQGEEVRKPHERAGKGIHDTDRRGLDFS